MSNVLIVGSHKSVKGGITTVINEFREYRGENAKFSFLNTYRFKNKIIAIIYFLFAYVKLVFKLIFTKIDIVHIHMSHGGSFFRKNALLKLINLFHKKTIIHLHSSSFMDFYKASSEKNKILIKKMLESVDYVIVLGENWKKNIETISKQIRVEIVNNCALKHDQRKIPQKFCILFTGVLTKRKGVIDLLKAVDLMDDSIKKIISVYIVGDGEEKKELIRFCNLQKLTFVSFLGWRKAEEISNLLNESSIFVLPSYNEGLPMSILEALSHGVPVISTDVGSINEAVVNDVSGFLIKPGDCDDIKEKILLFVKNEKKLVELSNSSYNLFIEKFSLDSFFNKIFKIYDKLTI